MNSRDNNRKQNKRPRQGLAGRIRKAMKPQTRMKYWYGSYYRKTKIDPDVILLESFHGKTISDSPLVCAREIERLWPGRFRLYYATNDRARHEQLARDLGLNVELVDIVSKEYARVLATAGYIISNASLPIYYIRKEGQVYLQTWHGTPLKTLGKQMREGIESMYNVQHNFIQASHLLFPNEFTRCAIMRDYNLERLYTGKVIMCGYPRNQVFLQGGAAGKALPAADTGRAGAAASAAVNSGSDAAVSAAGTGASGAAAEIRSRYDLGGKTVYAYMPTWRGTSNHSIESGSYFAEVREIFRKLDAAMRDDQVMYVNFHPIIGGRFSFDGLEHIRPFPSDADNYEFLNAADALVTDYSSVFFDFSLTRKPIILFMYDYDKYMRDRGMYMDIRELPFRKIYDTDELAECIAADECLKDDYSESSYSEKFLSYDAPDNTEKLLRLLLGTGSAQSSEDNSTAGQEKPVSACSSAKAEQAGIAAGERFSKAEQAGIAAGERSGNVEQGTGDLQMPVYRDGDTGLTVIDYAANSNRHIRVYAPKDIAAASDFRTLARVTGGRDAAVLMYKKWFVNGVGQTLHDSFNDAFDYIITTDTPPRTYKDQIMKKLGRKGAAARIHADDVKRCWGGLDIDPKYVRYYGCLEQGLNADLTRARLAEAKISPADDGRVHIDYTAPEGMKPHQAVIMDERNAVISMRDLTDEEIAGGYAEFSFREALERFQVYDREVATPGIICVRTDEKDADTGLSGTASGAAAYSARAAGSSANTCTGNDAGSSANTCTGNDAGSSANTCTGNDAGSSANTCTGNDAGSDPESTAAGNAAGTEQEKVLLCFTDSSRRKILDSSEPKNRLIRKVTRRLAGNYNRKINEIRTRSFIPSVGTYRLPRDYEKVNVKRLLTSPDRDVRESAAAYIDNSEDIRESAVPTLTRISGREILQVLFCPADKSMIFYSDDAILRGYRFREDSFQIRALLRGWKAEEVTGSALKFDSNTEDKVIPAEYEAHDVRGGCVVTMKLRDLSACGLAPLRWHCYIQVRCGENDYFLRIRNRSRLRRAVLKSSNAQSRISTGSGRDKKAPAGAGADKNTSAEGNAAPVTDKKYVLYPYLGLWSIVKLTYREETAYDTWGTRAREIAAMILYTLGRPYLRRKEHYIIYEKFSRTAQDNSYYFFRYCMTELPEKERDKFWYVIDKNSPDYQYVKEFEPRIIPFMSIRHMVLAMSARLLISTDSAPHLYAWQTKPSFVYSRIRRKGVLFLQHGVTAMKRVDGLFGKEGSSPMKYFVATSETEQRIVVNEFGYDIEEAPITGFTRWDALEDRREPDNRMILVMPTWRVWLEDVSDEDFVASDYYQRYYELLTGDRLRKLLEEKDLRVVLYLHPKFARYIETFRSSMSDRIELVPFGEKPLNDIMMRSSMLITDYSSVCWDMLYMDRPVVFYQFDTDKYLQAHGSYIDLTRDLPSPRTTEYGALMDAVERYAENGFVIEQEYEDKLGRFFSYRDKNNCERTYRFLREHEMK